MAHGVGRRFGDLMLPHTRWTRIRTVVNWINLSTILGFAIARIGGARVQRRGRGTWIASDYRYAFPVASAFTVGSVIISRHDREYLDARHVLLGHEDRHCTQFAYCFGPIMLPLYFLAMAVSWTLSGDHASYNPFERLANLADGGYRQARLRRFRP